MVLALFAAVAMVGTIGASTTMVMRGPMKVMSDVNQKAITESQLLLSSKMIMLDTINLTTADCDGDKLNEPRPWKDAAGAGPDGVAGSNGGGFIPDTIGTSKQDTWGTQYGYCVWDHGALMDDAGCGGAGQNRLTGANSIEYPVVAIISAGPNKTFETPCRDWLDVAPADGNLDNPLIEIDNTNDDLVMVYSYAEASKDNPSLWNLELDAEGNAVSKIEDGGITDVEFTGSNVAFGNNLTLTGTKGLEIPDNSVPSAPIPCDASKEGQIARNMGVSPPTLEICEDTGGSVYAWVTLSTGGSSGGSLGSGGTIDGGPGCAPTGDTLAVADNYISGASLANVTPIVVRRQYAYTAVGTRDGIVSFDISDPNNIQELDTLFNSTTMDNSRGIALQGNYAYVTGKNSNTLTIIDITDPTTMVEMDSHTSANITGAYGVVVSGDYAFVAATPNDGIVSFDISDPSNIVELDTIFNSTTMDVSENVAISGNYAYVTGTGSDSLTIIDISDPSNMSEVGSISDATNLDRAYDVIIDGSYAYVTSLEPEVFSIVDVSTPSSPIILSTLTGLTDTTDSGDAVLSGNYVFIVGETDNAITIIDISDPENPVLVGSSGFTGTMNEPVGVGIEDNHLFVASQSSFSVTSVNVCAQGYQGQVTVTQTGDSGTTLDSVGWSQVLASDTGDDQAGIAFVVEGGAKESSVPTAAIVANRSWDPSDMIFKTRDGSGVVNEGAYLSWEGYLGADVNDGESWKQGGLFSNLQIGVHDSFNWNSVVYQHGLLATTDTSGTDQIAYFGFEGADDASNTVMYSKDLKIKHVDITGSTETEYMRFESDKATTFFGDVVTRAEGASARIKHKSYSNTVANGGNILLRKTGGSLGSETASQDGDILGEIAFGRDTANSKAIRIQSVVNGPVSIGDLASELVFSAGKGGSCLGNEGGPFVEEAKNNYAASNNGGLWTDGTYIYEADGNTGSGINAYEFNGSNLVPIASFTMPSANASSIWGDGTYIYVAAYTEGIYALTFDGTTFTQAGHLNPAYQPEYVWGDGTYIYTTSTSSYELNAYTFDGSNFTLQGTYTERGGQVWGDGQYLYFGHEYDGLDVLTFDGSTFTLIDRLDAGSDYFDAVWGDGEYIYVGLGGDGIYVFEFDGTSLSLLDSINTPGYAADITGDGTYIYLADISGGIFVFTFDGTDLTQVENFTAGGDLDNARGIITDGTYHYVTDRFELYALSGYGCTGSTAEMRLTQTGEWTVGGVTPEAKFHSAERIRTDQGLRIGNDTTCAAAEDVGVMRYTGTLYEPFEVCDGTNWVGLTNYVTILEPHEEGLDCSPISFDFTNISEAATSSVVNSNTIIVGGIETGKTCKMTVAGERNITVNKNGSDETGTIVDLQNGDRVYLKITASENDGEITKGYISIGDKTDEVAVQSACTVGLTQLDSVQDTTNMNVPRFSDFRDGVLYVASQLADSVTAIDVSDPDNLTVLDTISSTHLDGVSGIAVYGEHVYAAALTADKIVSIDISDPSNMVITDNYTSANLDRVVSVTPHDGIIYATSNGSDSLTTIDISDPANLAELDSITSANLNGARDVLISDDGLTAFVVGLDGDAITAVDITDPTNLIERDSVTSTNIDGGRPFVIHGNYAFVPGYDADRFTAFDISDPTNIDELDSITSTNLNGASAVTIQGKYAYVTAAIADRIVIVDISDPNNMSEVYSITSTVLNDAQDIHIIDGNIFTTAGVYDGVASFSIDCP